MQAPGGADPTQSLNDIQDYLASFNKEIQSDTTGVQTTIEVTQGGGTVQDAQPLPNVDSRSLDAVLKVTSAGPGLVDNVVVQQLPRQTIVTSMANQPVQSIQIPNVPQNQPMEYTPVTTVTTAAETIRSQAFDIETKNVLQEEQKFIQMGDQQVYIQPGEADQPLVIAAGQPDLNYGAPDHGHVMPVISEYNGQVQQDTQLVAVQSAHDSNQPQIVALAGQEHQNSLELLASASTQNQQFGQDLIPTQDGNVVINPDGSQVGQYQTVTIVPSEVNQGGEVSYVLIVSNAEQEKTEQEEDVDLSVYDFKEEHRGEVMPSDHGIEIQAEAQKRIIKMMPKKIPTTAQLMCNYCNYTSSKKYLLTRHMKTHSEERPHRCNICDRGFKTVASLQNHVNTHTGTKPHSCKQCDACFTTSGELVRHVRYRHTHEKPHRCTECDYQSVELSKLKRHMRSHTGERPYSCPHCNYASPDTYKLKRHLRIHTGEKPYECDICHARFTQSNSLKAHRLIHSGEKPMFQCELCPTTCGRKTDLKIHIQKLHTSEKPLQCRKCAKSFPDRYTYKIHMKTHDGEKCYKCELCPYAALSERHLQSHILTHTGEKPFECVHCDQTFRQKQLLKRHLNLYHTPDYCPPPPRPKRHECSECDKCFAHKGNLLRHMALHDPESPMYQQLPPKTGKRIHADDEEDQYIEDDEDDDEEEEQGDVGQQKTVMIEVTQEGSDQQMFLLMEVPADADPNQQARMQIGETVEGAVPEGVEEAPDPSLMDDQLDEMNMGGDMGPPVLEPQEEEEEEEEEMSTVTIQAAPDRRGTKRGCNVVSVAEPKPKRVVAEAARRAISPRTAILPTANLSTSPAKSTRRSNISPKPADEPVSKRARRETPKKNDDESRRREEQIRKDIEECFGFDMEEDTK